MTENSYPFRNNDLPLDERVDDLLGRLTTAEKMRMLHFQSPVVEHLDIPAYNWWNEALHGVARNGKATVFPQCIGMAASFDDNLVGQVYRAIALEARAKYAASIQAGRHGQYRGLTFWTPNINIFRDPRWGRGQETWGECPELMIRMGLACMRGLQGENPEKELLTAACAKHYAVHSGPEALRHTFDAQVSPKDLHETYLPAFKALVEAGVETVMGAYNRTLGEPCCGSEFLLVETLRKQWGFQGHVVSDCWAVRDFHEHHKVTKTVAESAALALKTGCDLNCGCVYEELPVALDEGLIDETMIDTSLRRLLRTRFKLGMFDETPEGLAEMAACCEIAGDKHHALAYEAAVASMTLLKNDDTLPIAKDAIEIFVTGPFAASVDMILGNYFGINDRLSTILEGIVGRAGDSACIQYKPGIMADCANRNGMDWVSIEANMSNVVIAVCGIDSRIEGEEGDAIASPTNGDRDDIMLPQHEYDFLLKLMDKSEKPVVLIVCSGSAVALGELADKAAAILYCWYPGQAGGEAVADVLFGDANPAGRLPITVPKCADDLPPFDDYAMTGRSYRYATAEPLYPFGFGLSYTSFIYERIHLTATTIYAGEDLELTVAVRNNGELDGDEVVQCYLTDDESSVTTPLYQLVDFERITLTAGANTDVHLRITAEQMQTVIADGSRIFEPGSFTVRVGGCSPGERGQALGASPLVEAQFSLV